MRDIPRWLMLTLVIVVPLSWVPLAMIAWYRTVPHRQPRIHIFQDMDNQAKLKAQAADVTFADGRAMRPPIEGAIGRGQLQADDHLEQGKVIVDGKQQYAVDYPASLDVNEAFIRRGQERFDIYCAPCHGESGYGAGMIHQRAQKLETTGWVGPTSLHSDDLRGRSVGDLYNVIKWGRRTMPAYGSQIPTNDQWAIVAYMKALQLSQHAAVEDVPADVRPSLRQE